MEFVELSVEEFKDARVKFKGNSFYQTYHWAKIKEYTGWNYCFVGVKDKDEIVGCSMILSKKIFFNRYFFYAPRGLLLDYNNTKVLNFFIESLKKYLKEKNGLIFKIDPLVEFRKHDKYGEIVDEEFNNQSIIDNLKKLGFKHHGFTKGYSGEIQFRWSYCLDLTKTDDEIRDDMDQRCRRNLRKAYKFPIEVVDVDKDNIYDFKDIMESTALRQKHYDRSLEYYKNIDEKLREKSKVVIAYLDRDKFLEEFKDNKLYEKIKKDKRKKIPISAGVFIYDKERMNYVYGGTYKEYMSLMAPQLVQMEMIKYTREIGLKIYDFGGISGDFNPKSPNYGVYEFKRGFGGYVVEYIGEFDLILHKFQYKTFDITYYILRKIRTIIFGIKGLFRRDSL